MLPKKHDVTSSTLGRELETIVENSAIQSYIEGQLAQVRSPDNLVKFFRYFTLYNLGFPGGVASLAGAFHIRSDIFRDPTDPIADNADRSSIIASKIIFAAEDEFATRNRTVRITHRYLAQEVLATAMRFAGLTPADFNARFKNDNEYAEKARALEGGYRIFNLNDEANLFSALGFHLGSERLADIEFNAVHLMLEKNFPDFVKTAKATIGSHGLPVYGWISTHTSVEVDHYLYGVKAAEQASECYCGTMLTPEEIHKCIIDGFKEFVDFQHSMFAWLG